jgi:hypothetical protein
MKRFLTFALVFSLAIGLGYSSVLADKPTDDGGNYIGNGFPSGAHYTLNIIGVPQDKEVPTMTGSNRHTIFVPLNSGEDVDRQVKIKYVTDPNDNSFRVLDGNATDDDLAIIQVPFEYCTNLTDGCYDLLSFMVFARGLGKPGPDTGAVVTAECEYTLSVVDPDGTEGLTCEDTLLLGDFEVRRPGKKPITQDITDIFRATGCLDLAGEVGVCDSGDLEFRNIWIFNIPYLSEYMWDYDNNGLKLMQVRFYETTSGYIGFVE